MDEHLNIFYPYSLRENDIIKEDNITRAAMISFNDMKQNEKISFINKLVNKTILLNDNYRFEVELQPTTNINEPCIKYLVGFCPDGKVSDYDSFDDSVDAVFNAASEHNARPDGQISVYDGDKLVAVIIFENKLHNLSVYQLKRHFELILNLTSKEDIRNSLILFDYKSFFSLFKESESVLCKDLLEFMNINGYIRPESFNDVLKSKYNRKNNVEYLLGKTLDNICQKGRRERQTGWGETIKIKDLNPFIDMIGLIYYKSDDTVRLALKFASRMSSARRFYRHLKERNIYPGKEFTAEFCLGFLRGYIENSFVAIDDVDRYIQYLFDNLSSIRQYEIDDLKTFILDLTQKTGTDFDPNNYCYSDKRLTHGHINFVPTLDYSKYWKVEELRNKSIEDFANEIRKLIDDCSKQLDINIVY